MKKCIMFIVLLCLFNSHAQNWFISQSNTSNNLKSIFFISDSHGWTAGELGVILHTSNYGDNWFAQTSGVTSNLNAIYFTSLTNGIAVGDGGVILLTTNSGTDWATVISSTIENLNEIVFTNANYGYIVGANGMLLKTTNGGSSWTIKTTGVSSGLNALNFIDANNAYAVGSNGSIIKTSDAGETWQSLTSGVSTVLNDVQFIDINIGYAVGNTGSILKTSDAGSSWNVLTSGVAANITSLFFFNEALGWIVCGDGAVRTTTNGGVNWSNDYSISGINLSDVTFSNLNAGWIAGNNGIILKRNPYFSYSSTSIILTNTNPIEIPLYLNNVSGLHSAVVVLQYNSNYIGFTELLQGELMSGSNFSFSPALTVKSDTLRIEQVFSGITNASGSGVLFKMKVKPKISGSTTIKIKSITLLDNDNNVINAEKNITAAINIILPSIKPKIFLQGPFNTSTNNMNAALNSTYLPLSQPYNTAPFNYAGTEQVEASFFSQHPNIVDWVLVEMRTGTAASTTISSRAALLTKDGYVVDLDGINQVAMYDSLPGSYYMVIKHRNHLSIMTATAMTIPSLQFYDFTTAQSKAYGTNPMFQLSTGIFGMPTGDANTDGQITSLDFDLFNESFSNIGSGYLKMDFNLDGNVTSIDFNIFNPNFKNILTSQVPN